MDDYLPDLLDSWVLAMKARGRAAGTIRMYRTGVHLYLRWCAESRRPQELSKPQVQEWLAGILENKASTTAIARYKAVTQFSKWMFTEGEIDADPLAGLERPVEHRAVVDPLDDDELRALIKACQGTSLRDRRDEALVRLMVETGMRAGEVLAMKVSDISLTNGQLIVHKSKTRKGRVVPFGAKTATAIDRYMRAARRERRLTDNGPLWVGAAGKSFGYNGMDDTLKQRAKTAGVQRFRIHRLRHTFATRWLRSEGSEQNLMAIAGWSTRAMLDRYTANTASERATAEARKLNLGDL